MVKYIQVSGGGAWGSTARVWGGSAEAPGGVCVQSQSSLSLSLGSMIASTQTLDLQVEMADSSLFHLMPLSLPWTVFYLTLLRSNYSSPLSPSPLSLLLCSLWENGDVAMETSTEPDIGVVVDTKTKECLPAAMETGSEEILGTPPSLSTNQEAGGEVVGARWGLQFLSEVHQHLAAGGQGWCVGDKGRLLKIFVSRLREELRLLTAHPPKTREVGHFSLPVSPLSASQALLRELEQCYFCLYGHPHKKAKVRLSLLVAPADTLHWQAWGLQDHGADQVEPCIALSVCD